jgi:phosphoenolpyruvate-protein phosphotransferase (PTS system enzyme I)
MSATSILKARSQIRQLSKADIEPHLDTILSMSSTEEVIEFVKSTFHIG